MWSRGSLSRAQGGANPRTKTELRGLGLVCTRTSWATRNAGPEWAFRAKPIFVTEKSELIDNNSELIKTLQQRFIFFFRRFELKNVLINYSINFD